MPVVRSRRTRAATLAVAPAREFYAYGPVVIRRRPEAATLLYPSVA
ncbi:hypothetical protein GCM10029964_029130 [Kibdelosporangium lantanae]